MEIEGRVKEVTRLKYDEALELSGGYGKFQKIATVFITFSILSGELILNSLMFMELLPEFECEFASDLSKWKTCKQADFCKWEGVD